MTIEKTKRILRSVSTKKTLKKYKQIPESEIKYPKVLINNSCDAYTLQGNQIIYIRNGKKFCRTVKKDIGKKANDEKTDIYKVCSTMSSDNKVFLSNLFLVNNYDELCGILKKWSIVYKLSIKQCQFVASKFKIKSSNKMGKTEICKLLMNLLGNKLISPFKDIVFDVNIRDECEWLTYLLYKIMVPEGFTEHSQLKISDDMYSEYLLLLQKESDEAIRELYIDDKNRKTSFKYISNIEVERLKDALEIKFCSCLSKFVFQNKLLQVVDSSINLMRYNPIAICKSSIFNKRKTFSGRKSKFIIPFEPEIIKKCHEKVIVSLKMKI